MGPVGIMGLPGPPGLKVSVVVLVISVIGLKNLEWRLNSLWTDMVSVGFSYQPQAAVKSANNLQFHYQPLGALRACTCVHVCE